MPFKRNHIDVITLGCSKNLIDSERLMKSLAKAGYSMSHDPEEPSGEFVVVNTCGFIGDAKEQSVNMILELGELKKAGEIGKLVVMGCLSERYREELKEMIPEVDMWYGKFDWTSFINDIGNGDGATWERRLTTDPWTAYLKISEGCNRFCAFCAIPLITGRHKSRPIEEILDEVRQLVADGVKEFNIIAQDLSSYGTDIYGKHSLAELIDRMADVEGVEWIRLHYAYPSDFPYDILDVMKCKPNVCKYIDVALQHISDNMLSRMKRHITKEQTIEFIGRLRREVPDIKIRTTLMVGFPGETEEDFLELMDFVKEARFDRMGAFAYSEEEGTFAEINYEDDIPEDIKQERLSKLMELQESIAEELNEEMVGRRVKVLIDRMESGMAVGRTQWDSPEVDQEVWIRNPSADMVPGSFAEVEIADAVGFDLYAEC